MTSDLWSNHKGFKTWKPHLPSSDWSPSQLSQLCSRVDASSCFPPVSNAPLPPKHSATHQDSSAIAAPAESCFRSPGERRWREEGKIK